jgi:hypothetical protein
LRFQAFAIVHPSGQPISRSHSTGVNRLTDKKRLVNGAVDSLAKSAGKSVSDSSAAVSVAGSLRFLFIARLNMPAAPLTLKANLSGTLCCITSESVAACGNNKDSPAPLRNSEVASIKHPPADAIPQADHFTDEPPEVSASIGTKEPWYIFQQEPPRLSLLNKVKEGEGKA